jgi:hypothetical protein
VQSYYDSIPKEDRRGENARHWKGGRRIGARGYVEVWAPHHHSRLASSSKKIYVLEHRVVMEQKLGRPLRPDEHVHHKNGVRSDNRPANLELWSRWQPPGQRVDEKLAWAREFIALYG